MIDFHCHLLQGIDDGSRNVETSINILEASREQGVRRIICTPHFYASEMNVDTFLKNRQNALEQLKEEVSRRGLSFIGDETDGEDGLPELMLGAEVAFYNGISSSERIGELAVEGTDLLLIEMPFVEWRESHLEEIRKLSSSYTVIIAHLERFMNRHNKRLVAELIEMSRELPIRIQINAEAFEDRKLKRKLIKQFAAGDAHMLGSDCHGMHRRPPNLHIGREALRDKLGEQFLERMDDCNLSLLEKRGK